MPRVPVVKALFQVFMQVSPVASEKVDDRLNDGTLCSQVLAEVADVRGETTRRHSVDAVR
ncbi:hypothetical protein [Actinokineospora xionganensis]|uniref:Uncharacterized protein n=1 Tax=Actinokineospora xionganensis TaxID=2684470 RepID=A0ABR7L619_9PSEU|nr:hypothetical protein [Actinokineospora xionganensis]MBC6447831.1 hypothetical protein [Actinokineospora xionganensis]